MNVHDNFFKLCFFNKNTRNVQANILIEITFSTEMGFFPQLNISFNFSL